MMNTPRKDSTNSPPKRKIAQCSKDEIFWAAQRLFSITLFLADLHRRVTRFIFSTIYLGRDPRKPRVVHFEMTKGQILWASGLECPNVLFKIDIGFQVLANGDRLRIKFNKDM